MVPALVHALENPSRNIRRRGAKTIGEMQSPARDAVPVLMKALEDQNAGVRESAAYTVCFFRGPAQRECESEGQEPAPSRPRMASAVWRVTWGVNSSIRKALKG